MTGRTILLVRHGETDWNREGRVQGWAPVPLNERGRRQARALGERLAGEYDVDRIVTSDLARAQETAVLLAEGTGTPDPTPDSGWRERNVGVYQGLDRDVLYGRYPAMSADSGRVAITECPEGGESLREMRERVVEGWSRVRDGGTGETTVVVTHGGPIGLLLGHLKGQDALTAVIANSVSNCGFTEVAVGAEPTIRRENEQ